MKEPSAFLILFILSASFMGAGFIEKAPHFDTVMKIMAPLEYSGIDNLFDPDSKISIDFKNKQWSINTVYSISPSGEIVLNKAHRALCRGLSMYVYQRIEPLFPPDRFGIEFAKVKESNYFFNEEATHIILLIRDKTTHQEYLLDPSFKRYGKKNTFKEYFFMGKESPSKFLKYSQVPQKSFSVNSAAPLFIKNTYIVLFSVQSLDDQFDNEHFTLTIAAAKSRSSSGETVLAIGCEKGHLRMARNELLSRQLLDPKEEVKFAMKLEDWAKEQCGRVSN